jgi:hypothetical protein
LRKGYNVIVRSQDKGPKAYLEKPAQQIALGLQAAFPENNIRQNGSHIKSQMADRKNRRDE